MLKKLKLLILASILVVPLLFSTIKTSAATTVTITSPSDGATETGTSFTVTGTATADRKITVEVDGDEVGTTTSDSSGDWSLEVTGQDAGAKTITATASVSYGYVANGGDATISVINTVTNEKVGANISSGVNQQSITVSPDGTQMVSASGYGLGNVVKVWSLADPEIPVVTNTITVAGAHALGVGYSPDGTYFFVTSENVGFDAGHVTRFLSSDPTTNAEVTGYDQNFPGFIAFSSDSTRAYVGNAVSSTMSIINVATNTQLSTFADGGGNNLAGGPLMSDGIHGYAAAGGSNVVVPYNVQTESFGTAISVGTTPSVSTYNPDETRLIVSNRSSDNLSVINTATDAVVSTIDLGASSSPFGVRFSNDGTSFYVVEQGLDQVSVRNPSTFAEESTITVGDAPGIIHFGPDQTATSSVDFTLAEASSETSSDATLADTGQNTFVYLTIAGALVLGSSFYLRKRYSRR